MSPGRLRPSAAGGVALLACAALRLGACSRLGGFQDLVAPAAVVEGPDAEEVGEERVSAKRRRLAQVPVDEEAGDGAPATASVARAGQRGVLANPWAMDKVLGMRPQVLQTSEGAPSTMHVIGDTHGDEAFLFHSLLSTERFEIIKTEALEGNESGYEIRWKSDPTKWLHESFEVVVLGDVIDHGYKSRENLLTLMRLQKHLRWGRHLVVMMGNHEGALFDLDVPLHEPLVDEDLYPWPSHWHKWWFDVIDASGWNVTQRLQALSEMASKEDSDLVDWLVHLPVLHKSHGVLLAHGGLSMKTLRQLCPCRLFLGQCATQVVDRVNAAAHYHFKRNVEAIKEHGYGLAFEMFQNRVDGDFAAAYDILWSRQYSSQKHGAGTWRTCHEAADVAALLGVNALIVGHTTHDSIIAYCRGDADGPNKHVPVFVADAHRTSCRTKRNCEYTEESAGHFADAKRHLPQSLRVKTSRVSSNSGWTLWRAIAPRYVSNDYSVCSRMGECDAEVPDVEWQYDPESDGIFDS